MLHLSSMNVLGHTIVNEIQRDRAMFWRSTAATLHYGAFKEK